MPRYAFVRHIRSRAAGAAIPAISLTAYARTEDADYAVRSGFQEHFAKPADATALIEAVRKWTQWGQSEASTVSI